MGVSPGTAPRETAQLWSCEGRTPLYSLPGFARYCSNVSQNQKCFVTLKTIKKVQSEAFAIKGRLTDPIVLIVVGVSNACIFLFPRSGQRRPSSRSHEQHGLGTGEFGQRGAERVDQRWHGAAGHPAPRSQRSAALRAAGLYVQRCMREVSLRLTF